LFRAWLGNGRFYLNALKGDHLWSWLLFTWRHGRKRIKIDKSNKDTNIEHMTGEFEEFCQIRVLSWFEHQDRTYQKLGENWAYCRDDGHRYLFDDDWLCRPLPTGSSLPVYPDLMGSEEEIPQGN
jgi:hypothetical protein